MSLKDEIFEQPEVLKRLLKEEWPAVQEITQSLRRQEIDYIFLTARGSSDNAGLYAKYLWGAANRLPVALAAPSLFSIYQRPPQLKKALAVGISQSGQSPDIVAVLTEAAHQGCPTLAITNEPTSPLAQTADFILNINAGPEEAVAATKTYTAQLLAIAMLSVGLSGSEKDLDDLRRIPRLIKETLKLDPLIAEEAERYRYMDQCVVLGRGFNYATTFEWALKLKELAYIQAQPYSSADFRHGPVAMVSQGFPVLTVAPSGPVFKDILALLKGLLKKQKTELLVISDNEEALSLAHTPLRLPMDIPEWLTPLVTIVAAQLFCFHLTQAKGFDTEAPRGLKKVTLTK